MLTSSSRTRSSRSSWPPAHLAARRVLASYALCGFANFGSLAIMLGGLGALAPSRRGEVAELGLRALVGTLATLMAACWADPVVRRLLLLLVAGLFGAGVAHAEPVEISVLTYNIHGLPTWIALDDPTVRIPQILDKARAYDVVLLQEDFAYQSVVDAHNRHPHLWRGSAEWLAWVGAGAGLTTLSKHPSAEASFAEPYAICNGWIGAANDCFGNKGFLQTRLALADAAELDVWNTHLDAGGSDEDRAARKQQLEKLATAMESRSRGRAVLVGGDFNLEWSNAADHAILEAFAKRLGLAIAARTPPDGWKTHLDYLLVRDGDAVCVEPASGGKDEHRGRRVQRFRIPGDRARLRVANCKYYFVVGCAVHRDPAP